MPIQIEGASVEVVPHPVEIAGRQVATVTDVVRFCDATQKAVMDTVSRAISAAIGEAVAVAAEAAERVARQVVAQSVPNADQLEATATRAALRALTDAMPSIIATVEQSTRETTIVRDQRGDIVKATTRTVG